MRMTSVIIRLWVIYEYGQVHQIFVPDYDTASVYSGRSVPVPRKKRILQLSADTNTNAIFPVRRWHKKSEEKKEERKTDTSIYIYIHLSLLVVLPLERPAEF